MTLSFILIATLLGCGAWLILSAKLFHDKSFYGHKTLSQLNKWHQEGRDIWDYPILKKLVSFLSRYVFLDMASAEMLSKKLSRAGLAITPKQFTARKYVVIALSGLSILICALLKFWLGILLIVLFAVLLLMKQSETLSSKLKKKDEAIALEMPRFIRTICRNLRSNRDIYAALQSYRKVAGPVLGAELDILLAHMRAGGVSTALQQFQSRLGTEEAFRLCSILMEIDRGIDQTATLDYLADDMARQAKLKVQKTLSSRPAKMRRTYLPAVGICVVMILYVLIVFVQNQLNNLF